MTFCDIGIFYVSSDGKDWAGFLQQKLVQMDVTAALYDLEGHCARMCSVNIVLATPDIVDLQTLGFINELDKSQSLMVLLGVDEGELKVSFIKQRYTDIFNWKIFEAKQTSHSVSSLIECILLLLDKVRRSSVKHVYDSLPPNLEPRRALSTNTIPNSKLHIATSEQKQTIEVLILTTRKGSDEIDISFSKPDGQPSTKAGIENKALYCLQLPEGTNTDKECNLLAKDGALFLGSGTIPKRSIMCMSESESKKLAGIDFISGMFDDPVSLMCQIIGLSGDEETDTSLLDKHLAVKCQKLSDDKTKDPHKIFFVQGCKKTKWPTPLHFAAEYNLIRFASELLKLPFSIDACLMKNCAKETPKQISNRNGFREFTGMISNFIKLESLKGNIPGNKDSGISDEKRLSTISEHNAPSELSIPQHEEGEDDGFFDAGTGKKHSQRQGNKLFGKMKMKMKSRNKSSSDFSVVDILNKSSTDDDVGKESSDKMAKHNYNSKSLTLPHVAKF